MKKELYCSKAIAVLLKEKKFKFESDFGYAKDENCPRKFFPDDGRGGWHDNPREWYKACTLDTIVEMFVNKGVLISIVPDYGPFQSVFFHADIYEFNKFDATYNAVDSSDYRVCLEKAIVWVLENISFD